MNKLTLATLALLTLTGCWNGTPFQVDFQAKGTVDYPEGDPRRAGTAQTQVASGSTTASGSTHVLGSTFQDYNLLPGTVTVKESVVLQPRNQYPDRVPMYRLLGRDALQAEKPRTAWLRVTVYASNEPTSYYKEDADGVFGWTKSPHVDQTLIYSLNPKNLDAVITVKGIDGFEETRRGAINNAMLLDGLPVYKILYLETEVNGYKGWSRPFVLAPSQNTIEGKYIPVQMDAMVRY